MPPFASATRVGLTQVLGLTRQGSMLANVLVIAGVILIGYGVLGLVAVWLAPSLQRTGLWGKRLLTGRMRPTRLNQSLMCLWASFFGGYVSLATLGLRAWSYTSFVLFFVCAVIALFVRTGQAGEA